MKDIRSSHPHGLDANGGQIVRINELIPIITRANQLHRLIVANELKKNRQQAQASAFNDGWTANDDNIQIACISL